MSEQSVKLLKPSQHPLPHVTNDSKIWEQQAQLACSSPELPQNPQNDLVFLSRMVWPGLGDKFPYKPTEALFSPNLPPPPPPTSLSLPSRIINALF